MIDRYAIYSDFQDINQRYGLAGDEFTVPNYNASPAQQLPVVSNHEKKEISFFYWGIGKEWSNNKSISSKLLSSSTDQIKKKNPLKRALIKRRCIVPVNGFYLWKQYGKKRKTPHYFYRKGTELFSLAGIWEEFDDINGEGTLTFKFVERENYSGVEEFGDAMPAIISPENESAWLDEYTSVEELFSILENTESISGLANHPSFATHI